MKKSIISFYLIVVTFNFSCGQDAVNQVDTPENIPFSAELFVDGIEIPWGLAFLPDGSMLVTEISGEIFHVINGKKTTIDNVPEVYRRGQGGLLDIEPHPDYENTGWIYITYSSSEGEGKGGNTQLIRAKLKDNALIDIEKLYKADPNTTKGQHFGSRIVFDNDGYLFFSVGDRGNRDENPQDITRDGGKVYRLNDDGSIPEDNPFVGTDGAKSAIYSYGHRNPQGMAKHPESGKIWDNEHGPRGGDEINEVEAGKNYGWPVITYGINYSGTPITDKTEMEGMEQPLHYWVPSIAPSGMAFITSDAYGVAHKGDLLVGSLAFQYLERLKFEGTKMVKRDKWMADIGRVRSVEEGPDGLIYVGVEGKGVYKLVPASAKLLWRRGIKVAKSIAPCSNIKNNKYLKIKTLLFIISIIISSSISAQNQNLEESIQRGSEIYADFCVTCHLEKGEGVPHTFPPLAKSDYLINNRQASIRGVKYGQQGEIVVNGITYNNVMAPLGLEDEEIADVMNFVMNSWGNTQEELVTVEEVEAITKE